ncbi:uncharacterized protein LOC119721497 [Patiria miniata]|uniref:Uncharacterized protein n=1 Tax=Patiria miniata TaxID=46514 RepID=A0A913Z703_PATMI|nr:uncharacterized protein LOC119721497 [Patiria miniata]
MNWVGGVRNRLKTKDEKQRQKDFFEKMKYGSRVKKLKRSSSGKEGSLGASLDLLSLQAADFSAEKFRKSDSVKSTKTQVKKVELDRSRGLFPLHHRCEELELSMSPGAPSKLQLQDPDQRNTDYPHSKEHMQTAYSSFTTPSEQLEYDTYGMKTGEAPKTEYSDCQSYPSIQSSSQFHSTPVVEEFPQAPVPQQHQGKHFEDLFFSCIPNDTLTIKKEVPDDLSVISDEQLSEEFDYSPLSSIPSESSAASSLIMLSPDSQPTFEHDQMPVHSSQPGLQFQSGGLHSSPIDLTQYTIGPRDNEMTKHPISDTSHSEDWVSDSSLTTVCDHYEESHQGQRQQEDSVSTVQQVDLICGEEGDFLSPFCKRAKVSSRKTSQENPASPEISTSTASPVDLSNTMNRGKATEEQNSLKKEDVRSVCTEANSFKWKAFVSGQAFREKPVIDNKDRI